MLVGLCAQSDRNLMALRWELISVVRLWLVHRSYYINFRLYGYQYLQSGYRSLFPDFVSFWRDSPLVGQSLLIHEVSRSHTTHHRTHLDKWSARRRDLYPTTHNNRDRRNSMPPAGFDPTISAAERPPTYVLDRAATGVGCLSWYSPKKEHFL